jgi:hypothetical protein
MNCATNSGKYTKHINFAINQRSARTLTSKHRMHWVQKLEIFNLMRLEDA